MRWIIAGLMVAACVFVGSRSANAELVLFNYTGEVTAVADPDDVLGGSVSVGMPLSGRWVYETTTTDYNPDPSSGMYNNAVSAWTLSVGGNSWEYDAPTEILVANPAAGWDSFEQDGLLQSAFGSIGGDLLFTLTDFDGTAFDSDALPSSLEVSDFETRNIDLWHYFDPPTHTVHIGGTFTSISSTTVPEPNTLTLLAGALGCVAFAWRRRRR